ncbi:hypothetical protein O181_016449 [Austropuccinia psidii MF-1]|uniref:Uncharacterized protein n=1 Tax=Austropuccinia psidii MF-1 TaxID=1389203 RepID=A0A9Q3C3W3_9BASI|nr:hypothetical protein [Austropuccinia psidii MF-1]
MLHQVGHITSVSRQCQLSNVSHENVTQRPNPFQHYSQCLGNFTSLAFASQPNPPQRFACLCIRTDLQMRLRHCPPSPSSPLLTLPHPRPYHLYAHVVPSRHASDTASHPYACCSRDIPQHCLPSLRLRSALPTCSQHCLPSLHSQSALPTYSQHCLPSLRSRSALPTCSQHCLPSLRSRSALPTCSQHCLPFLRSRSALLTCSRHCLPSLPLRSALPTCSRHCLPSLHSRSALLTCSRHCLSSLRSRSALQTCSQHCFPSLFSWSALPTCSRNQLSLRFLPTSIVYGGLLAYTMNAIAETC